MLIFRRIKQNFVSLDHSTSSDSNTASAAVQIDNVERLLTIPYESLLGWGYTSDSFIIQYYFNEVRFLLNISKNFCCIKLITKM